MLPEFQTVLCIRGSQSVVRFEMPAASPAPVSLLAMQIFQPDPSPSESEILGVGPNNLFFFLSPPGDSGICYSTINKHCAK